MNHSCCSVVPSNSSLAVYLVDIEVGNEMLRKLRLSLQFVSVSLNFCHGHKLFFVLGEGQ